MNMDAQFQHLHLALDNQYKNMRAYGSLNTKNQIFISTQSSHAHLINDRSNRSWAENKEVKLEAQEAFTMPLMA